MNYYTSDIIPNSGSVYKIVVNHQNYESITASTYIPEDRFVKTLSYGIGFGFKTPSK